MYSTSQNGRIILYLFLHPQSTNKLAATNCSYYVTTNFKDETKVADLDTWFSNLISNSYTLAYLVTIITMLFIM